MIDTKLNRKLSDGIMTAQTAPRLTVNGHNNGASEIEFKHMRFLITDRPTEATLDRFIEVCRSALSLLYPPVSGDLLQLCEISGVQ